MKILWIENQESFVRIALKQFLSEHAVTVVPSLAAARAALSINTYDLALVDYDLDDGKGTEVVSEIRSQGGTTPMIATSSHERGNALLLAAGANAVCNKMHFKYISQVINDFGPNVEDKTRTEI